MKTLGQAIGFALIMEGLWVPCYIASLLPDRWSLDYWWSFPALLSLLFGGILTIAIGGFIIGLTLIETETN